jgi:4-amino-4-deoxy-L-arabinose transferase-like glycosyltransferase
MKWLTKHPFYLLTLVCLVIFFVNLDAIFVNIMEARNFITAREMIHDGHWLLTTMNGEPRYAKPPLPTWLTAIFALLFGLKNLFALRLPAAIMGLVLVLVSYKFLWRLTKHTLFAFLSGLIMVTSFYILNAGRDANWDIFTHSFMMVCIYFLYLFFTSEKKKYQNALLAAIFFGCSFMSKGPVSFYALLLPFLIAFGMVYRYKNFKSNIFPFSLFLVVSLILSAWWHWYTYTFDPVTVAAITQRETSNWAGYETKPFYYYWSFFTQSGVWTILAFIGLLYPYLKNRVFDQKAYRFTFLWTMGSLILLSIIPEKKVRYLLPVMIPLAMNTGFYLEYLFRRFRELSDRRENIPVYFNFGLIATIGVIFPLGGYLFLKEQLHGIYWIWFILLAISLLIIGIYMFRNLYNQNIAPVFYLTIAFIMAVICFGMPLAKTLTVNPEFKGLSQLNDWQSKTDLPVYEFGGFSPELIWDYGKPIKRIEHDGIVTFPLESTFGILLAEDDIPKFRKAFKDYSIEKITRYDMNPQAPGHRSHRNRLWRDLYLVVKE